MPPSYFPLRWESTGDQWWFASPIDWAAANGHYDLVKELLYLDTNLLIKLTSLCRIRRLETVWDDGEEQFQDVAKCRSQVAQKLLLSCESKKGYNTLIRAGYGGWLLYTAASAGDMEFVMGLIKRDPFLVFGEGEYGVTDILYAAARSKNCEVFRFLFDSAISPRCFGRGGEELGEDQSVFKWDMINRSVHAAARGGNVMILKEILGDCLDVLVYRDALGSTLLHSASSRGQVEVTKFLLASYGIVNAKDHHGNTALHVAAYRGYSIIIQILLDASPATALLKNNFGDTFLHMAVAGFISPGFQRLDRLIELVKQLVCGKLVNMEEVINVRNNDGRTVLHMAAIDNIQPELVELLISVPSINLNARDADGNTALDILKQRPKSVSSELLIKQLIFAGGISNCQDHTSIVTGVSRTKFQGIGGSPGTSFRIPDAELFLCTGIEEGGAFDDSNDFESTDYDSCSGDLSYCVSSIGSDSQTKKLSSLSNAANRLKNLIRLTSRNGREYKNNSLESYRNHPSVGDTPISLRQRSSTPSAMLNNKRVLALPSNLPRSLSKKKFTTRLIQGVIQVKRQLSFASPSSTLSESSWPSPMEKRSNLGSMLNKSKVKSLS